MIRDLPYIALSSRHMARDQLVVHSGASVDRLSEYRRGDIWTMTFRGKAEDQGPMAGVKD